MKKLLLILPLLVFGLLFSPTARADDHHRHGRGHAYGHYKRNRNDGLDRYYNRGRNRSIERRSYQGRSRYYRDGRYYYRGRDGYYPYGSRRDRGGVSISF